MRVLKPLPDRDTRIKPTRRRITLLVDDYTPLPFSAQDQEWIGDYVEDLLRQRFDVIVDLITITDEPRD